MSKGAICFATLAACVAAASADAPRFTPVQPEVFAAPQALSNAFADVDGDPDLHAGVSGDEGVPARNLLFRNEGGTAFVEVAENLEMIVLDADSRQANWLDYHKKRFEGVDPRAWAGKSFVVKAD